MVVNVIDTSDTFNNTTPHSSSSGPVVPSAATSGMQPGEALFPLDADQAHYLNVMMNLWRWRTPSPLSGSTESPGLGSIVTPPSLHEETSAADTVSSGEVAPRSAAASPTPVLSPDERHKARASLMMRKKLEAAACMAGKTSHPMKDTMGSGKDAEGGTASHRIQSPKGTKKGRPLVAEDGLGSDSVEGSDGRQPAKGAAGAKTEVNTEGEAMREEPIREQSPLIITLDTSRAASLKRTCKFGGYFRKLPEGCELTIDELREMATRQQQQIESQQQLLVAREQRLKFLQQQESRAAAVGAETDNLRSLQERVETQEAKLRRLRALRGQDTSRMNTVSMTTDLDAIRHLFSEKEKELVIAVAKVEELTRQLEDIRNGGSSLLPNRNKQHSELEKLRRELLYRNSVNREASTRISTQKDAMTVRCDEVAKIDKRIGELQQRLQRKRLLNQQLASQITAATQAKQAQLKAVQLKALRDGFITDSSSDIGKGSEQVKSTDEINCEFGRAKQDPKYQTLPYNTKFSSSFKSKPLLSGDYPTADSSVTPANSTAAGTPNATQDQPGSQASTQLTEDVAPSSGTSISVSGTSTTSNSTSSNNLVNGNSGVSSNNNLGVVTRTVHSIPAHHPSRGHAMAPSAVATAVSSASSSSVRSASTISVKAFSQTQPQEQQTQAATAGRAQPPSGPNGQPLESRPQLPPTSLSINFAQKLNVSVTSQCRSTIHNHAAEVQNIRATVPQLSQPSTSASMSTATTTSSTSSGIPATSGDSELDESGEDVSGGSSYTKVKPALPPKPLVPAKPLPPPRQKGDPLASSTESLNAASTPASQRGTPQQRSTQVYRYASQNMIMSAYTQQSGGGDSLKASETQLPSSNQKVDDLQPSNSSQKTSDVQPSNDNQELDDVQTINNNLNTTKTNSSSIINNNWQMDRETDVTTMATAALNTINSFNNNSSSAITSATKDDTESSEKVHVSISRRIEMPPDFMFPEDETPPSDLLGHQIDELDLQPVKESDIRIAEENGNVKKSGSDVVDNAEISQIISSELENLRISVEKEDRDSSEKALQAIDNYIPSTNDTQPPGAPKSFENDAEDEEQQTETAPVSGSGGGGSISAIRRMKKGNLKTKNSTKIPRRVSFDPLALLLDASLEGELELVKRTAMEVPNPSAANDEGITALHNSICAGHYDIVTFLISFGCDVNAPDSDGWTPLHCAASCNNVAMVKYLVEHGACILATTLSDHETAAEKCEQDEEGYDGCSQYLYSIQEKLGIMNGGVVYAVYEYESQNADELTLKCGDCLTILRRGDEYEREWWWAKLEENCGYIPRNLLGLYPRVKNPSKAS